MQQRSFITDCFLHRLAGASALLVLAILGSAALAQEPPHSPQSQEPVEEKAPESETTAEAEPETEYYDLLEPSNTGYIDDAVVRSGFRLRADSATGSIEPDRAEFLYGKCLCFEKLFGQDGVSPGPADNLDFQELELSYEHALGDRFSLFLELPFRAIDLTIPDGLVAPLELGPEVSNSGLGDLRAGMKYALIAGPRRSLTVQLRGYFASGDAAEGLGTDHHSIEPGLLYLGRLSKRFSVASELRWWHPLGGSSDPVSPATGRIRRETGGVFSPAPGEPRVRNHDYAGDVIRLGIGASYQGRGKRITISPVAEVVGWHVVDGYGFRLRVPTTAEFLEAGGDTIVNLKLGARLGGRGPGSWYLGYGFPLTDEEWYDGIARIEYRRALAGPRQRTTGPASPSAAAERPAPTDRALAEAAAQAEAERLAAQARDLEQERARSEAAAREAERRVAREEAAKAELAAAAAAQAERTEAEVRAAVGRWSESWAAQQIDGYLAAYSPSFEPANGISRSAWESQRRRRLAAPRFINVALEALAVTIAAPNRAVATFTQHYESNTYRDTVAKRLVLELEEGAWKIRSEEVIAAP